MRKIAHLRGSSGRVYHVELSTGQGPTWLKQRLRQRAPLEAVDPLDPTRQLVYVVPEHVEAYTIEPAR